MNPRVTNPAYRLGRLSKARQFATAASLFHEDATSHSELRDAYVTLAVHSGIASSDVIAASVLGEYSSGDSHSAAVSLLKKADSASGTQLARLLELKTKAGYGHNTVSHRDVMTAYSCHIRLLGRAEALSGP
jgi:hypothetical protein